MGGGPASDVDLLIDVPDGVGLFALGWLETELREFLGAPVDLIPLSGLKPRVRREVLAEVQPLRAATIVSGSTTLSTRATLLRGTWRGGCE